MIVKEQVTIAPKRAGQTTKLSAKTRIGNKWFVLTKNWKVVPDEQFGKGEFEHEEMMDISFSRARGSFRFAFDLAPEREKPEEKSDIDDMVWRNERSLETDKHNAAFNFFAKHMQIQVVGMDNPHLIGEAMFIMDFVNHRTVNNCIKSDKKVAVYNKVNAMSMQEKMNLALYFMPNLYGKRHSEIKDKLINLETGLLMQDSMVELALNYDPTNTTVSMRTYVNKAIQMGILTSGANGFYMQGNIYVGANEHDVMGYFLQDPASYNNVIVPAVNKLSKLPEDDLLFTNEDLGKRLNTIADYQRNKAQDPNKFLTDLKIAQEEAERYGIKNVYNKKYATLLDEIDQMKRGVHKYSKKPKDPAMS
jgi:hypothetical protein